MGWVYGEEERLRMRAAWNSFWLDADEDFTDEIGMEMLEAETLGHDLQNWLAGEEEDEEPIEGVEFGLGGAEYLDEYDDEEW